MNKVPITAVIANIVLGVIIFAELTIDESSVNEQNPASVSYDVKVDSISADDKEALPVILKNLEGNQRQKRITARYFLPASGERNALTDAVDGMVIEGMRRNLPIAASFEKLLEEEGIVKAEKYRQKNKFQSIVREYMQTVYKIQRGMEKGDILAEQDEMKSKLFSEIGLDSGRLQRLMEIEKKNKSQRQLRIFEQLLIRDDDKMSDEQRRQVSEILTADQTTLFDPPLNEGEIYERSDSVLNKVSDVLEKDQAAHFRYFQEYHWHSYDVNYANDMPTF